MRKSIVVAVLVVMSMLCGSTIALAATPHQTTLNWNAVVPVGATQTTAAQILTGYNIYRSTTPGGYTFGTPFATVPFGTETYVDSTPTAGQVFYYVATTVCSNCTAKESGPSNEIKTVTPLDNPVPPTAPVLSGTAQ